MIYTCKPVRMAIYVANGKKTMDEIKAETGCDVIINGGLFELKKPSHAWCHLKSDGIIYASDPYKYYGYGWHTDKADIRLAVSLSDEYNALDNYICCDCLIKDGHKETLHVTDDRVGQRPRTAIGIYPDGRVWFYAEPTKRTPESMQAFAMKQGLDSAVMLDGGDSTQGISPSGAYRQTRKCHNYILAWLRSTPAQPCPYEEPTTLQSRWNYTREGAKWVQWFLNYNGQEPALDVDGIIGGKTHAAIMTFQTDNKLIADGIVGRLTRSALKAKMPSNAAQDSSEPIEIIRPNYQWNGSLTTRAGTTYIILHHAAATTCTAEQTHIFHRDQRGWIGIGYNFFVRKDGTIYEGRPIDKVGAHTVCYNNQSVGVCFEGNFEIEQMGQKQIDAGRKLVKYLKSFYPSAIIKQHKDLAATACAGKYFPFAQIAGE